jgi:phospholipid-translocating ATPase
MSFFKRRSERGDDEDTDEEAPDTIDPQLRLRTVRTAASSIAEAARLEDRQATRRLKPRGSRFFRRAGTEKRKHTSGGSTQPAPPPAKAPAAPAPAPVVVPGIRRNIYLNLPLPHDEADTKGEPLVRYVRNKVRTTSAYPHLLR